MPIETAYWLRQPTVELEFVQCQAIDYNPNYLNFLAQRGYFKDPTFINYLKYLLHWKEPDYAKYLKCIRLLPTAHESVQQHPQQNNGIAQPKVL
ncbi:hypothetical protein TKK_0012682 [Trichogramma kaykai]